MIGLIILLAAFVTAILSGIFGMAGGLILMGVLALVLPVPAALATHGLIQSVSNGWRAVLLQRWIAWRILSIYLAGSLAAALVLVLVTLELEPGVLFLLLGLVPALVWLPKDRLHLNAERPLHALFCGFSVTGLNVIAGVSGPLLDVFFVQTSLDRRAVVATKAATQVIAHAVKIAYFIAPALAAGAMPQTHWLLIAAPLAVIGTTLGARVLELMSDAQFRQWTKWIVTVIGLIYIARGLGLLLAGPA